MTAPHDSFQCGLCWLGATLVLAFFSLVAWALVALIVWVLGAP